MSSPVNMTVAICTWNRCESLRQTLEHMCRLRVPDGVTWELLVINNNCTDATDQVCCSFVGRLPLRVLHEKQPGLSFARNLAVQEGRDGIIVWTDDDVLVPQDWLVNIRSPFEDQAADWVFGPSEPEWPGTPPRWYSRAISGNFAVLDYGPTPFLVQDSSQPFFGLNFAGTRDAHVALGGFKTDFGLIGGAGGVGEDVDLFERAVGHGMRIAYAPLARVRHVIPPARATKSYQRRHIWRVNAKFYAYMGEMFPRVPWLLGLPRFMFRTVAGNLIGYLRAVLSGDPGERFFHELQLVRFSRFALEAAKNGFGRPKPPAPQPKVPDTSEASR